MRFNNQFLDTYLDYVEETESPRIFHIWAALAGVSAAMGRRVWFDIGLGPIWPNMYTVLVGPPATRKTMSMKIMRSLLQKSTGVKLAPADTCGQKQGLIAALQGTDDLEEGLTDALETAINSASLTGLSGEDVIKVIETQHIDLREKHVMFACAEELNMFLGTNSLDMLTFLLKMWDGDDYDYKLKSSNMVLKNPLMNLFGCTTPAMIAESMPAAAMGQGFTSRMIFVYCHDKHGSFPRGSLKAELEPKLCEVYSTAFNSFAGKMGETKSAASFLDDLHDYQPAISDPRFLHYVQRRKMHMIKLAMALAAARMSMEVDLQDMELAHTILCATEPAMSDALGEYGLSPLAASKQRLVEFIVAAREPITVNVLWAVMHKEMKRADFVSCLADLTNAGKIQMVHTKDGPAYVEKLKLGRKPGLSLLDEVAPPG